MAWVSGRPDHAAEDLEALDQAVEFPEVVVGAEVDDVLDPGVVIVLGAVLGLEDHDV